jgi:predicted amidophosphoribosyltransferase
MIRCGFCGHEFAEEEGIKSCGRCGKPGGCSMVRCPRCFYENPEEPKILKKLKRMLEGDNK